MLSWQTVTAEIYVFCIGWVPEERKDAKGTHVVLDLVGHVEVDDVLDVGKVQAL